MKTNKMMKIYMKKKIKMKGKQTRAINNGKTIKKQNEITKKKKEITKKKNKKKKKKKKKRKKKKK